MSAPESPETGGGSRRNSSIPAFLYSKPALDIEAPTSRDPTSRRISFDVGWLTKSVRRTSVDVETPAINIPQSEGTSKPSDEVTSSAPASSERLAAPAPNQGRSMGERRKSESVLWKWFNTPMVQESSVIGKQISESDEMSTPAIAGASGAPSLTQVAQQMSVKTAETDTSNLTAMNPGKFGALKMVKRNASARDLNALSPSNW